MTAKGVQAPTSVQLHFSSGDQSQAAFNAQAFLARLTTENLGCTLLTAAELPSTQTLLHDNSSAIPNGTVCVADRQIMGKGEWRLRCQGHSCDDCRRPSPITCISLMAFQSCIWCRKRSGHCSRHAGRGHNTWESPAGCLMFSVLCHLKLPGEASFGLQDPVLLDALISLLST